ncbi:MAG: sulfatase-like hydrolase/transferase [Clostridia bacterium]|nr:sulfatase-like hydrolase/transferase [Clostridia bacterium]
METLKNIVEIDKRKGYVGSVIGLLMFVICCTWYNLFSGIIFGAMFTLVGFIRLNISSVKRVIAVNAFGAFFVVITTWLCSMAVLNVLGRMGISVNKLVLNFLCIVLVCFVCMIFTGSFRASIIIGTALLVILCLANGFVFQFRGKELSPLDFLSLKTAANVAGQYIPKLTHSMFYGIAAWGLSVFMLFCLPVMPKFTSLRARMLSFVTSFTLIIFLIIVSRNIPIKLWDSQGTRINGYFLNFFIQAYDSTVDKPKNYSADRVRNIFDKNSSDTQKNDTDNVENKAENQTENMVDSQIESNKVNLDDISGAINDKKDYPNIVVIMDESFADFRVLGENFNTNIPVTPYIDSMDENTQRGYAMVSVYGGNTANSEFEFLTSHSMSFLPNNSVPYQQYINDEIYSLPWLLRSYGYKCASTHPYYESGWSREFIYPRLGFSESTFIDDYVSPERIRDYVSDKETFKYMLDYLKGSNDDKPVFMFGITMQNHGGYSYNGQNFTPTVKLEGYSKQYSDAEQYLTLANATDSAVEYLINELSLFEEDTIVLFFGDHFPSLNNEFYQEIHGGPFETFEEQMLLYTVPYFIWANFDIPEYETECTSLNYLSIRLLEIAGIPKSPFYNFLKNCETVIPSLNSLGFYSVESDGFVPYTEANPVELDWLEEYSVLQYNNLIDYKHRDDYFKQHISSVDEINIE